MESFQSFNPHSGRSKPSPAIFSSNSPPRISSDPQPSSKKSHLPSLHHHPHRHHHHHRHAKSTVQSAVQLHAPTSFGDLLKQASRSKDTSPSHSRRESVAVTSTENNGEVRRTEPAEKPVRPEDVERKRAKVKAREEYVNLFHLFSIDRTGYALTCRLESCAPPYTNLPNSRSRRLVGLTTRTTRYWRKCLRCGRQSGICRSCQD
jgi:hypothetical protein